MSLTHVVNTDPDNKYEPYTAANPMPVSVTGGGDASASNQATMITHLSDIDTAVTGTLNVSDSTAQSSLSSISSTVAGTLTVSDSTAQASLSSISSSVAGTLVVSDSTAQSSLATIAGAVAAGGIPALNLVEVSDTNAQSSLSTIAGAVSGGNVQVDIVSSSGTIDIQNTTVSNKGSAFNGANNATLASGALSSAVDITNMNHLSIFYEDSNTALTDKLTVMVSPDNSNYFELVELFPSTSGAVRNANLTDLAGHGLTHLKLRNDSGSNSYSNVNITVVGAP